MGIKIWWQFEFPAEHREEFKTRDTAVFRNPPHTPGPVSLVDGMLKFARSVARPDTEIVVGYTEKGTPINHWLLYPRTVMKVEVLNKVIQAERDGYDAAIAGVCYCELFLEECRQAVRMPVVGPAESSMLLAQLVGKRFAIVTIHPHYVQPMEQNIHQRGWTDRAIAYRPVRHFEPWMMEATNDALIGKPEKLISDFDKVAQECVRDGADTIICGCAPCGATLALAGYREVRGTGVPVVSAVAAEIKLAEALVDLRRAVGLTKTEAEVGPYQTTPPEVVAKIQKDFGFVKEALGVR